MTDNLHIGQKVSFMQRGPMGMGDYCDYKVTGKIIKMDEGVFILVELDNGDRKHVDSRSLVKK